MSAVIILIVSIIVLLAGYFIYDNYLEKVWEIDANCETPACKYNDGVDYVPTRKWVVFGHHFASIAGASPINGPILASPFGWVPVLLWILLGSVFIGSLHDFAALYSSVKNKGKSTGFIIELYMGKKGKIIFLIFVWLLAILVIAAFADIVAATFDGMNADGSLNFANASAASTSMLFIFIAVIFGIAVYKFKANFILSSLLGVVAVAVCMVAGLSCPIFFQETTWLIILFIYIFIAATTPVWLILQPRDFLNSFLLYGLLLAATIGIFIANPTVQLPAFSGFIVHGKFLFPVLFITVACGAVSGFHSLIASGTTAKQISNEKDIKFIASGSMLIEAFLAVLALICVGVLFVNGKMPAGSPPVIFAKAVSGFLTKLHISGSVSFTFITLAISAFALTSLDSITRVGRMTIQELFAGKKFITNPFVATALTLICAWFLSTSGYETIWTLFGTANQLLAALALTACVVYFKKTGKKHSMFYIPIIFMFAVTIFALIFGIKDIINGMFLDVTFSALTRLFFSVAMFFLAIILLFDAAKIIKQK